MTSFRTYKLEPTTNLDNRPQSASGVADFRGLLAVVMFSLIGLLIAANLMFRFPDPVLTVEQFNTFAGP